MKIRHSAASILFLIATLIVSACGSSSSSNTTPSTTTTITGSVYAASVSGASVVVKTATGASVAGPVTTSGNGSYTVNVPSDALASDLRIESVSGSYADEATGSNTTAGTLAAYVTGGTLTTGVVNLDPSSTIIHALVTQYGMSAADATAAFAAAFGYTPDTSVAPKNAATDGSDDAAQRLAGLHAGVFSQLTASLGLTPDKQFDLLAALAQDLNDGALDGKNGANVISIGTGTLPEDIGNEFENALVSFMSNTYCNLTGLAEDEIGTLPFSKVALTDTYRIEYVQVGMMGPTQGKTEFKLSITNRATGSPVPG